MRRPRLPSGLVSCPRPTPSIDLVPDSVFYFCPKGGQVVSQNLEHLGRQTRSQTPPILSPQRPEGAWLPPPRLGYVAPFTGLARTTLVCRLWHAEQREKLRFGLPEDPHLLRIRGTWQGSSVGRYSKGLSLPQWAASRIRSCLRQRAPIPRRNQSRTEEPSGREARRRGPDAEQEPTRLMGLASDHDPPEFARRWRRKDWEALPRKQSHCLAQRLRIQRLG